MERAGELMVAGKYDGALMIYAQVLGVDPDHDPPHALLRLRRVADEPGSHR